MTKTFELVRAMAQAAQPVTQEHKKDLFNRVQRLKMVVSQPHVDENMRNETVQLEQHLNRVLRMEEELLKQQKTAAKKQVQHIRPQSDSSELARKLDKIQFLLGELGARMNSITRTKGHHEKRKRELDTKVQRVTTKNENMQKKIDELEKKIEQNRENIPPERLAAMMERIRKLRAHMEPLPTPRLPIKHEMIFQEIDSPKLPISEMESQLNPPPAAHKSFVRKLFGM
ncbi:MAG TPA: hypothetical protein VJK72_02145 [Candidatus Nanoarchaeia archaeon]|nr:hypothetical protein [Candidatus Nanoarchaeia archaeon]